MRGGYFGHRDGFPAAKPDLQKPECRPLFHQPSSNALLRQDPGELPERVPTMQRKPGPQSQDALPIYSARAKR